MSNGKFAPGRPPATEFMVPPPGVTVEMSPGEQPKEEELDFIELLPDESEAPEEPKPLPKKYEAKAGIGAALDPEMPQGPQGFW